MSVVLDSAHAAARKPPFTSLHDALSYAFGRAYECVRPGYRTQTLAQSSGDARGLTSEYRNKRRPQVATNANCKAPLQAPLVEFIQ